MLRQWLAEMGRLVVAMVVVVPVVTFVFRSDDLASYWSQAKTAAVVLVAAGIFRFVQLRREARRAAGRDDAPT
ncbi:hypothetical protein K7640_12235 [Micromonospora sp. PLK6-60]|uniref:hypothetical protein n=1 Tax=Micromonospora sp. PLK6-60 TaxID=2873383 RepID=UPI001CA71AF4|nr:hypothetical protein [Micromonospora sp. PLK6-60]MBY8872603.1 hypothetical protein [Micromonospora sp. PLK6-60]